MRIVSQFRTLIIYIYLVTRAIARLAKRGMPDITFAEIDAMVNFQFKPLRRCPQAEVLAALQRPARVQKRRVSEMPLPRTAAPITERRNTVAIQPCSSEVSFL